MISEEQQKLLLEFLIQQLTERQTQEILRKSYIDNWLESPKQLLEDWNNYLFLLNNDMLGEFKNGS